MGLEMIGLKRWLEEGGKKGFIHFLLKINNFFEDEIFVYFQMEEVRVILCLRRTNKIS